ncbi:juvenile hormone acid O-methyltransferase-like [Cydia amplana]|uniref:juvenile hormone acid O-methyltransferase-like n=1 Tax=Cydia amplana TaxID=1869771 RepID=UPI002FE69022
MQDPKAYQHVNNMQSRDLEVILKENSFEWKQKDARIMDVGCGDGSATMGIWKKHISESFMIIVGSDKSQACVNFAKKNYEGEKVKFITLDIEGQIPDDLKGCFDHVVSNYVFHWVQRQEKGFSNIYDMLAKEGKCLLIFLGNCNCYENYRTLSRTTKWNSYLKDVKTKLLSPYHDSQASDPQIEIRSLMRKIGFRDINIQVQNLSFDFERGIDEFRDLMKCLNPFDGLEEKWEDFMDEYVQLDPNAGTIIYQLLVVSGTK